MTQNTCGTCAHYRRHYVLDQRKIFRVYCGHCTYLKAKTKRPDSKICENYVQTAPDEEAFASKEYLSKTLLEYMLRLELLPEIHTGENKTSHPNG